RLALPAPCLTRARYNRRNRPTPLTSIFDQPRQLPGQIKENRCIPYEMSIPDHCIEQMCDCNDSERTDLARHTYPQLTTRRFPLLCGQGKAQKKINSDENN